MNYSVNWIPYSGLNPVLSKTPVCNNDTSSLSDADGKLLSVLYDVLVANIAFDEYTQKLQAEFGENVPANRTGLSVDDFDFSGNGRVDGAEELSADYLYLPAYQRFEGSLSLTFKPQFLAVRGSKRYQDMTTQDKIELSVKVSQLSRTAPSADGNLLLVLYDVLVANIAFDEYTQKLQAEFGENVPANRTGLSVDDFDFSGNGRVDGAEELSADYLYLPAYQRLEGSLSLTFKPQFLAVRGSKRYQDMTTQDKIELGSKIAGLLTKNSGPGFCGSSSPAPAFNKGQLYHQDALDYLDAQKKAVEADCRIQAYAAACKTPAIQNLWKKDGKDPNDLRTYFAPEVIADLPTVFNDELNGIAPENLKPADILNKILNDPNSDRDLGPAIGKVKTAPLSGKRPEVEAKKAKLIAGLRALDAQNFGDAARKGLQAEAECAATSPASFCGDIPEDKTLYAEPSPDKSTLGTMGLDQPDNSTDREVALCKLDPKRASCPEITDATAFPQDGKDALADNKVTPGQKIKLQVEGRNLPNDPQPVFEPANAIVGTPTVSLLERGRFAVEAEVNPAIPLNGNPVKMILPTMGGKLPLTRDAFTAANPTPNLNFSLPKVTRPGDPFQVKITGDNLEGLELQSVPANSPLAGLTMKPLVSGTIDSELLAIPSNAVAGTYQLIFKDRNGKTYTFNVKVEKAPLSIEEALAGVRGKAHLNAYAGTAGNSGLFTADGRKAKVQDQLPGYFNGGLDFDIRVYNGNKVEISIPGRLDAKYSGDNNYAIEGMAGIKVLWKPNPSYHGYLAAQGGGREKRFESPTEMHPNETSGLARVDLINSFTWGEYIILKSEIAAVFGLRAEAIWQALKTAGYINGDDKSGVLDQTKMTASAPKLPQLSERENTWLGDLLVQSRRHTLAVAATFQYINFLRQSVSTVPAITDPGYKGEQITGRAEVTYQRKGKTTVEVKGSVEAGKVDAPDAVGKAKDNYAPTVARRYIEAGGDFGLLWDIAQLYLGMHYREIEGYNPELLVRPSLTITPPGMNGALSIDVVGTVDTLNTSSWGISGGITLHIVNVIQAIADTVASKRAASAPEMAPSTHYAH